MFKYNISTPIVIIANAIKDWLIFIIGYQKFDWWAILAIGVSLAINIITTPKR